MTINQDYLKSVCRQAFSLLPVDFIYLFGSTATRQTHRESDIDVAVAFSQRPTDDEYSQVFNTLCKVFHVSYKQLDMGDFDRLPVSVQFRVIRDGKLIYSNNEQRRLASIARTMAHYHDEAPLRRFRLRNVLRART